MHQIKRIGVINIRKGRKKLFESRTADLRKLEPIDPIGL